MQGSRIVVINGRQYTVEETFGGQEALVTELPEPHKGLQALLVRPVTESPDPIHDQIHKISQRLTEAVTAAEPTEAQAVVKALLENMAVFIDNDHWAIERPTPVDFDHWSEDDQSDWVDNRLTAVRSSDFDQLGVAFGSGLLEALLAVMGATVEWA